METKEIDSITDEMKSSIAEERPKHRFRSYRNDGTRDCIGLYKNLNHPLDRMAKETKNELISVGEEL